MAKIRSISPSSQRVKSAPTEVDCQFAIFHDKNENKILHLSTFGSDNRASAPKSSQSIQLDYPMAEQLVELLVDTFGLVPGGSKNSTDVAPVPLSAHLESTMDRRVAKLIGSEHFRIQYDRFRPRFSPLSIGMLLTQLIDGNGRSSYSEVAAVLGIRPARVRQSIAVLSQVINEDGASILYENGVEVLLEPALLFEQFRIVD